jgi:hypothetical protein
MHTNSLSQLPAIFQKLTDPRGVRFPYHALCGLVFLGLLARINEMAVLIRWAESHWEQLRDPSQVSTLDLMRLIRGHWQIENCLHFVKDRWWDEDRHWTKRPGLGAVFAALTNAAISVLRMIPDPEPIRRAKTEKIQWNPDSILKLFALQ